LRSSKQFFKRDSRLALTGTGHARLNLPALRSLWARCRGSPPGDKEPRSEDVADDQFWSPFHIRAGWRITSASGFALTWAGEILSTRFPGLRFAPARVITFQACVPPIGPLKQPRFPELKYPAMAGAAASRRSRGSTELYLQQQGGLRETRWSGGWSASDGGRIAARMIVREDDQSGAAECRIAGRKTSRGWASVSVDCPERNLLHPQEADGA